MYACQEKTSLSRWHQWSVWNICLTKQIKFNLVMRVCWVVRLLLQLGLTSWNPIRFVLVKTKMFPSFFKAAKISIIILIFGNCSKICVNWFFKVDFLSSLHKGISPEDFWEVWKNIPICRKSLNNFQKINRSIFL